ncbi:MAG: sulfite exporter TauE/SafE family protein [Candidatus Pacebacteria bacterium]|nr:sulfite exporter TauE/SafE family protein [Candidatus Paceibacterota bacterium]
MESITPFFVASVFFAGNLMFLAPCTLPLLPAYIGFLSGLTQHELAAGVSKAARRKIFLNALLFVLGFTLVFSLMGVLAGFAGSLLTPAREWLRIIGGVFVIFFGVFMLGAFSLPLLLKERRLRLPAFFTVGSRPASFILGAAFGIGWTPCSGPVLGSVLSYAGTTGEVATGAMLLAIFSLGFSVPFLALAAGFTQASRIVASIAPFLRVVSIVGGVILIIMGLWLLLGHTVLTEWFFRLFDAVDMTETVLPYL